MDRAMLKQRAKDALRRNFWLVMLVVLVGSILGVGDLRASGSIEFNFTPAEEEDVDINIDLDELEDFSEFEDLEGLLDKNKVNSLSRSVEQLSEEEFWGSFTIGFIILIMISTIIFSIIWTIFFINPLQVGYRKFFINYRNGYGKFSDLFSSFSRNYLKIVKSMFTTNLIIFGWSLLFIIPGIIKSYQYFFVPYLLADNPEMTGEEARRISTQMTDGYKLDIFVLCLSFIGWIIVAAFVAIILGILTCCCFGLGANLAHLPLSGYMACTYAELYSQRLSEMNEVVYQ